MPLNNRDYMRPSPPGRRFRRPDGFTINPLLVLIIINVVLFVATSIKPDIRYELGFAPILFTERAWTVITAMFIHSGFSHVLFNMLALFFFGRTLKAYVGENRFLIVYFVGGIAGNLLYYAFNSDPNTVGAYSIVLGASGAIYAIGGALAVMVPKMKVLFWGIIPMPLWLLVAVFFGIMSLPVVSGFGIAWESHLGGLVTGLIAGYFLRRRMIAFRF